jgi:autotransporter-associated beta strand protein
LIDVQTDGSVVNGSWQPFDWSGNSARLNVDGYFDMWDGNNVTVDALTGSGTVDEGWNGGPNLTVGIANGSGTFSGTISNAQGMVSLTKTGTGIQTLSGSNSYNGATTVSNGKLLLGQGGSMGATAVSVTGGATYGMARTSSGASVQGGSTLSLGSGTTLNLQDGYTNTMSFTSTGVLSGAGLYFDLGTTTADCDILALTGAATVTGTNTFYFDVLGSSLATGDHAYTLITAASGLLTGGTFAIDTTLPEYTLTLDRQATAVYLNVVLNVVLGDTNGDFVVDAADYIALKTNFGMTQGATLAQGNFDADIDGNVDWDDLQILMANFSTRTIGGAPAIPEPATLGLLAIGALAVLRRRRAA